eukprot:m.40543 g.40543  ORF g.40543 m.40543 type:complete len:115 (+) comp18527_c0_seq1:156-500(+)
MVKVAHILIKHCDSRRCASWRDPDGHVILKRSKDDAKAMLQSLIEQIKAGTKKFKELASTESDCGSHEQGGDLGEIIPGVFLPEFEVVAMGLEVEEISPIIETESGVHVLFRTA